MLKMYFIFFTVLIINVSARQFKSTPLAVANNHLAIQLYHHLYKDTENVFFSPFSVSSAFGMLYLGAKNETADEMNNVLGYNLGHLNEQQVRDEFEKVLTQIAASDSTKYQLNIANRLVLQEKFRILNSFKDNLMKHYNAEIKNADFVHNGKEATDEINKWVSHQTHDKIKKLLDKPLDSTVIMVLLNAIYFKGSWHFRFEKNQTKEQEFYNYGKEIKNVQMMRRNNKFNYTEVEDLNSKLLELPYSGDDISMYILLPNEKHGIKSLMNKLESIEMIDDAIKNLREEQMVYVTVPKFKVETLYSLTNNLKELGMKKVFNTDADLSGIDGNRDLYVSDVIHKAFVEVNEEGTEAAASTGIIVGLKSHGIDPKPMLVFKADHPFMYLIRDNRNGMILFIGHINKL